MQMGIDSEGSDMEHKFMVEETPTTGRTVKTIADSWMSFDIEFEPGLERGPLPDVVVEKDSYFELQLPSDWPRVRSGAGWRRFKN